MKTLEKEIAAAAAWLTEQASAIAYGTVGIVFVLHDGRLTRTERTVSIKGQTDNRDEYGRAEVK